MPADKKVLNYKYAIFPTLPQRKHLARQMRECRLQYNRAVRTRKRLKGSILCFKIESVLRKTLSMEKNNEQHNRRRAIDKIGLSYPGVAAEKWATLYDLKNISGNVFKIGVKHTDLGVLAAELNPLLREELNAFRAHWKEEEVTRPRRPPKRPVYFRLLRAISNYAGFEAKTHMDKAFVVNKRRIPRSNVRFSVSGSAAGSVSGFEQACNPSPEQRRLGNPGEPRFKRRVEAYGYQEQSEAISEDHVLLKGLPFGMERVRVKWHRPLPEGAKIKQVTVMESGFRWYVVLTVDVPESAWHINPASPQKAIGLDPGAVTALTAAVLDRETGEIDYKEWDWRPLEQNLEKLEAISQKLSNMQGPDRRKGQKASKRWKKLSACRRRLHAHIKNKRLDMHHKISRELADHGLVAIGAWEPPKEVKGRKEYREGEAAEVPQGPKGIVTRRRGGRDRGIASLRTLTEQKGERAGVEVVAHAEEQYTTQCCSVCKELTGPKKDVSTRERKCSKCGTGHHRDKNAALNILNLALEGS